ncbi:ABC transporter ATP-binding protein [Ottowia beijingensis]|uniref:ABC transporter ATP-binding protein n=1 Tax=Ottowia beijingensis TaxID=1207057 RepID=A0A853IVJ5_9BURK|nr:ATP-binding cassette domain-containing protein [Ottowia beijingensis]NZA01020.1 ABC transporter ATP-binding protein [Ottowia beijingensis]
MALDGRGQKLFLLEIRDVTRRYTLPRESLFRAPGEVQALRGVSLNVTTGRSMGIVGESGSGKSTLARLVMALEPPTSGKILFMGRNLHALPPDKLRAARRDFQMVFQDPYGSLDPRRPIWRTVAEPAAALEGATRAQQRERAAATLESVGLRADALDKYPHEFSGGQRQRIAIARALITKPQLIVADEAVSALDVSVQAQVLNLMADLRDHHGVTFLFISHDLAVVSHLCADVAVMKGGLIVEQGPVRQVLREPAHDYTRTLLESVPELVAPAGV